MNITKLLMNYRWSNFDNELEQLKSNSYEKIEEIKKKQLEDLKQIYSFALENIELYKSPKYEIDYENAESAHEILSKLPITDKNMILDNEKKMIASHRKHINMTTGGSTGKPLSYKLDWECYKYSKLLKYRGYSYAGYELGDSLLIFGGGSLVKNNDFKTLIKTKLMNVKKVSSYGITEKELFHLYKYINSKNKLYIYGYVSSIYFLALYIEENSLKIKKSPKAIFTTSEVLLENQRQKIEQVFQTSVYNDYGINDGGGSAHECKGHCGMHIDTERSILEVVDEYGNEVMEGTGKLLVTSLKNYTMPFFRYDTGDNARITHEKCICGRETPRILEIIGRSTDYLKFGTTYIGSPALTVLMGKLNMDLYQIVQTSEDSLLVKILYNRNGNEEIINKDKKYIEKSLKSNVKNLKIDFQVYKKFEDMGIKNKYKIIEKNIGSKN